MTEDTTDDKGREYSERPWGYLHGARRRDASTTRSSASSSRPGKRLSYQFHAKRAEHWFIVSGQATVILDGVEHDLGPGSSIDIAIGQAHRCENYGTVPVVFIEVQHGTYFGEDDIVRLEDDFGRAT